jgi:hypothetical protein
MIPYLTICQLGIWLLVLITAVSGFSKLLVHVHFSAGLSIIMGGSTLIGKTHCGRHTFVYTTTLECGVR